MSGVVVIVQARMGSTRLPGKVLMDLAGRSMVAHVLERARSAGRIDSVVLATPDLAEDGPLVDYAQAQGVHVVTGSADDVLARYAKAARASDARVIVRITGDCPLIDPAVIDETIEAFLERDVDYCSNILRRTYPIGMDTEVFTIEALLEAESEAEDLAEREHVTPYLFRRPERFSLHNVEAPESLARPELRLTVDEQKDLELAREVLARTGPSPDLRRILQVLDEHPELRARNADVVHRHIDKPSSW